VRNLLAVAAFRQRCRALGVAEVALAGSNIRIGPVDLPDSAQLRLRRLQPKAQYKAAAKLVTVPRPVEGRLGSAPMRDVALLDWCVALIGDVLVPVVATR
jgi:transcription-repair coupling factor (superfamily II helicase)